MKDDGLSYRTIAKHLGVSCTTVHKWITTEPVVRKSTIVRLERKELVTRCLEENPDLSIREIASFCDSSASSVFRTLKLDMKFSKKSLSSRNS